MFKVDSFDINIGKFPDGTQKINFPEHFRYSNDLHSIYWVYDNDQEYITLLYIVSHIRNKSPHNIRLELTMPYVPNARQDRVYKDYEVFTLKYFCNFINSLNFDRVYVTDVHSDVALALLNNVVHDDSNDFITQTITKEFGEIPVGLFTMFYPDSGSVKRYSKCEFFNKFSLDYIYGEKNREWRTREITDLKVFNQDATLIRKDGLTGKTVLMIDDIICHGDTLAISARKLKSLGAEHIYACATFVENGAVEEGSKLLEALDEGVIDKVYTTDILLTKDHERVVKMFNYR